MKREEREKMKSKCSKSILTSHPLLLPLLSERVGVRLGLGADKIEMQQIKTNFLLPLQTLYSFFLLLLEKVSEGRI